MIQVSNLHARYSPSIPRRGRPPTFPLRGIEGAEALRGLDLEVKPGRIYALLGPNGAGKTTLLRCLTGLLRPTSGSLQVLDNELLNEFPPELFHRVGVLMESPNAYARMTTNEYLNFLAGFYTIDNPAARIEELAAAFELESLSTRIGKLSQGNKRKVQLMRSLLHRPPLVLWDEPTEHLDPRAQRLVLSHLRRYVSAGNAALVTSHRLEQMEDIADDYGFLKRGLMVHALSRQDLSKNVESAEVEGTGTLDASVVDALSIRFDSLQVLPPQQLRLGTWGIRIRDKTILTSLSDVLSSLIQSGGKILRAEPHSRSLEDLYRHYVEDAP